MHIYIDQKPYESPNPTTGGALYSLGQIQAGFDLYREVSDDAEAIPIADGPELVHLHDDEHFRSGPPKEFTIIVNARKKVVATKELSFDQVIQLAFNPLPTGPNILFTVTYGRGPKANPEGSLLAGGIVKIKDGMVFSVTVTDKS